jgi:L-ascorbate metabolism protein UlaG (beta-lactamase superfamily)
MSIYIKKHYTFFLLGILLWVTIPSIASDFKNPYNAPYDGERFQNLEPFPNKSFFTLLEWKLFKNEAKNWPNWVEIEEGDKPVKRSKKGEIIYSVINHATVLIQVDGVNILTDPMWSERASPVSFMGPKRVHRPGLAFEELPPIDLVIISHNHYDHLDIPTLQRLSKVHKPLILVGLKNGDLLRQEGIGNFKEVDWYQTEILQKLKVTFLPNQHWSARSLWDKFETLWGGFIIESKRGQIYFAGDTGYGDKFIEEIKSRYKNIVLSFLPIGSYAPRWFMKASHMNPPESIKAHIQLKSKRSVGIHFGTFQLTDEGRDEPVEYLKKELSKTPGVDFQVPEFGKTYKLPR